jgi:hypothetical protein
MSLLNDSLSSANYRYSKLVIARNTVTRQPRKLIRSGSFLQGGSFLGCRASLAMTGGKCALTREIPLHTETE